MTNALTEVREKLATVLTDVGLHAFKTVPDRAVPPMVYVAPGSPYVSYEGAAFRGEIVRCNVIPVASRGTNDGAAEELDDLVLKVLDALRQREGLDEFLVNDVGLPGQVTLNGQQHLAVAIEVQTEIQR